MFADGSARGYDLRASSSHGGSAYTFDVPLLDGDHVTDDAGTGFVHTAPGHGREDFDIWTAAATQQMLRARGIDPAIPYTVDADSLYTKEAPGFEGKRVLKANGDKGDANDAVIKALAEAGMIIARARLKHQYPHSWRSKKPVIFRNTPQWFIHMDKPIAELPLSPSLRGEGRGIAPQARPRVRGGHLLTRPRLPPPLTPTLSPSKRGEGITISRSRSGNSRSDPSARPSGCRHRARTASPA